jgi:hypothetical protein
MVREAASVQKALNRVHIFGFLQAVLKLAGIIHFILYRCPIPLETGNNDHTTTLLLPNALATFRQTGIRFTDQSGGNIAAYGDLKNGLKPLHPHRLRSVRVKRLVYVVLKGI